MPPPNSAELPLTVELFTVRVPKLSIPPAELPLTVQLFSVNVPPFLMPPPAPPGLPEKVLSLPANVPSLEMPPPPLAVPSGPDRAKFHLPSPLIAVQVEWSVGNENQMVRPSPARGRSRA